MGGKGYYKVSMHLTTIYSEEGMYKVVSTVEHSEILK